jgi:hypothetical protein
MKKILIPGINGPIGRYPTRHLAIAGGKPKD